MSNQSNSGGIGFMGLLAIVFVVLQLTGIIDWSWWLVLSPIWLPVAVWLLFVMLFLFLFRGK